MRSFYLVLALCIPFAIQAQWENAENYFVTDNEVVDQLTYQALQTDNTNNIHTCWLQERDGVGFDILYDRRSPDGDWNGNATINEEDEVVREAEMQVEGAQQLHFVYTAQNATGVDLYVASVDGAIKTVSQITEDTNTEHNPSIAIDGLGNLHICWIDQNNEGDYRVFYANNSSGDFIVEEMIFTQPSTTPENAQPKIEVTDDGAAHMMYVGMNNSGGPAIRYVFNNGLNFDLWQNSVIIVAETLQESSARFAIDENNRIHLIVEGSDGGNSDSKVLYYGKQVNDNSFQWEGPAVVDNAGTLQLNSVDVTTDGFVHLGMDAKTGSMLDGNAMYATNSSGAFIVSSVIDNGFTFGSQITIDNVGTPYLIAINSEMGNGDEEVIVYGDPITDATDPGVGIDGIVTNEIAIVSAPEMDGFTLVGDLVVDQAAYQIFDLQGKLVDRGVVSSNNIVSTALLPAGMYAVLIRLDHNTSISASIVK